MKTEKTLFLDTKLPFGKYQGYTMQEIIDYNLNYAEWFVNIYRNGVSDEVMLAIKAYRP